MLNKFSFIILLLTIPASLFAGVRMPAILSDHMVLQQNTKVRFWGWCNPGEKIQLKEGWDNTVFTTVGSPDATWRIELQTPAAGGPYTISIKGDNEVVLQDVLVGEVWVCSGQSNMEMNVNWGLPYQKEAAAATNTQIRFFYIPKTTSEYPQDDVKARWVVCNPEDMKNFSAAGYFFGEKINQELRVPVGLINANWSGSPAEAWTPEPLVMNDSTLAPLARQLPHTAWWPVTPGAAFNAMIYPISQFAMAGALWYQGETNVGTASGYHQLLTALIQSWRKAWNRDLAFYFVQIAPFAGYGDGSSSSFLREAQARTLGTPNTGMVITTDLVDSINDIHPRLKKEVGYRLAALALAKTYNHPVLPWQYPSFSSMKLEKKGKVRIYFDHAANGLVSKNGAPVEFYLAGADKVFHPAATKIEGSTVLVWSASVPQPVAVRYAFHNASQTNLFNKEGLPVMQFRTDDWNVEVKKDDHVQ